ncbi:hypothetical protein RRG08_018369 [Elysia crispata]|uniref:Uncharacterized protein n=1 Tax=Elysia crispata TaxID=231223 RepID=A0AAE0YLH9_9GAST|nr:hypothetical protein RRG08_018369 [Elysia crispata]
MQQITAHNVLSRLCHVVYGIRYSQSLCSIFFGTLEVCRVPHAVYRLRRVRLSVVSWDRKSVPVPFMGTNSHRALWKGFLSIHLLLLSKEG